MMDFPSIVAEEHYKRAEAWLPSVIAREPTVTSADKAYAWLAQHGMYVPRRWVRAAWGETIRSADYMTIANRLDPTESVPRDWMEETAFQYGHKYNFIIKARGILTQGGEEGEEFVTITADDNISIGEAMGAALNIWAAYGFDVGDIAPTIELERIKYRPDFDL